MIVKPPVEDGATQVTTIWPAAPGVPATPLGAVGTETGVIEGDGPEAILVPKALVAVTVKVYAVPLVSPVTVQVNAPVLEQMAPPGLAVTL